MQTLAEPVSKLIEAFCQLPGIGPKTASRLAYFLLRSDENIALNLAKALEEMKANTVFCSICFNIADQDPCPVCTNQQRDHGLICLVEEPLDVQAIERTREFMGVYHVLHGAISPVEGIGPDDLKIGELLKRIERGNAPAGSSEDPGPDIGVGTPVRTPVREVLLATNPNLEGEATAMYISRLVKPLGIRVTRLARGLPMGGDLEYADEVTLGRALAGRSDM
ncbi:MAG: recombination mediator RecR [Litorilinea sp.]